MPDGRQRPFESALWRRGPVARPRERLVGKMRRTLEHVWSDRDDDLVVVKQDRIDRWANRYRPSDREHSVLSARWKYQSDAAGRGWRTLHWGPGPGPQLLEPPETARRTVHCQSVRRFGQFPPVLDRVIILVTSL